MKLKSLVLAAGKGTRLQTEGCDLPKVMREALNRPLLGYVLEAIDFVAEEDIVLVVGYQKEKVTAAFPQYISAVQAEQLGTGHAVICAEKELAGFSGALLVCYGDMPLIKKETYKQLCELHISENNACTMLTGAAPGLPFGRILRDESGSFLRIVEDRDCTAEEAAIEEKNSGVYVFDCEKLFAALKEIKNDNAQNEYYLTDVPEILVKAGERVGICERDLGSEIIGVNTVEQLREVEDILSAERQ